MRRTVCSVVALAAACALAAFVALAVAPAPANAAVMGIDFGSEYIKVASVKPGTPFHIVVDEQSKRKIPSIVAFDNGERHFGNGAVQLALRKPKDTYIWAHRLLGKDINAPQVEELKKAGYAWEIVSLPERGTLGFRHAKAKTEDGADTIFSVEEIVAMSLQHVMKIAEVDAEAPVKDCVLTVPPYWTHRERQALLDAAEIAGLNVLSLINENAAAAVQYGIDRKYTANETHNVMFYNMGSTSTKVNLATYSAYVKKDGRSAKTNKTIGQFEIIGMGYDDTLGGFAFEQRITDYVVKEVNAQLAAKGKTYDVRTNMKAMAKIRAASEKAKTVLSANQESLIFLNSLYEDTDFKMMLQRDAFLTMVDDLVERTTDPIQQALDESGLTLDQIDAVVIIGGGLRIPAVQAKIKSFVQKEHLTQSLNGDEAMVMGAVFRAANLSTTFQVRPFGMIDTTPYAVGVRLTSATAAASSDASDEVVSDVASDASSKAAAFSKRASLFKRLNRLGKKKTVQFTHTDDFDAQLAYEASTKRPALPVGISLPIDHYNITGLARLGENAKYVDLLKDQKPKVSLSFLLDGSGLASLVRAEATLEEMVRVPVVKKKPAKTEEKKTEGDAEAKTDAEKPADDATATDAATNNAEADKTGEGTSKEGESEEKKSEDAAATTTGEESEPEFTMKKKTHTIPLTVVKTGSPGSVESMNTTHKLMSRATLEKLRRADDMKKEIAASKNALEAHIYATRSQMNEPDIEPVSTEEQREEVRVALAAAEEWLYDQGDESAQIFKDKLAEVKALSDPIFFRLAEVTAFPIALNTTQTLIEFVRKQCIDYAKNRPWVPEADRMKLKNRVEDLAEWLEEQQALQAKVQAHEKPVLESEMLYDRIRPIHKMSNDLMKLKKPIEKAKKKEKKDAKKDKKDATADKDAKDAEATSTDAATDKPAEETAEKTETKSAEETQAQAEATADSTTTEPKDEL